MQAIFRSFNSIERELDWAKIGFAFYVNICTFIGFSADFNGIENTNIFQTPTQSFTIIRIYLEGVYATVD